MSVDLSVLEAIQNIDDITPTTIYFGGNFLDIFATNGLLYIKKRKNKPPVVVNKHATTGWWYTTKNLSQANCQVLEQWLLSYLKGKGITYTGEMAGDAACIFWPKELSPNGHIPKSKDFKPTGDTGLCFVMIVMMVKIGICSKTTGKTMLVLSPDHIRNIINSNPIP